MFEIEFEGIQSRAGALKAEIAGLPFKQAELNAANDLINQAVSKVEVLIATRHEELKEREGGPKLSGDRGLVGNDDTEEVEEEHEEDELDAEGAPTGNKTTVKKTVKKTKAKKS